jgi:DNA adenine methylase
MKQLPKLKDVEFICSDYSNLIIPNNSIIYCDSPYRDTKKYSNSGKFNHEEFYEWCRNKKIEGHTIFISEYNMPNDFKCVWEKEVKMKLDAKSNSEIRVEKLFTL